LGVQFAFVGTEEEFIDEHDVALWKVARERHGHVLVLAHVLLENSGRAERLFASLFHALDDERVVRLVSHRMRAHFQPRFENLAAESALAHTGIGFFLGCDLARTFLGTFNLLFKVRARRRLFLAPNLMFVVFHVTIEIFGPVETFATHLAIVRPNGVHGFLMKA
jgi:hypothetical protein